MKAAEIRELVTRGFFEAEVQIEKRAVERIVRLSEGLDSALLSLRAGERAVNDDRDTMLLHIVIESAEAVMRSHSGAASLYHHAIESSRPENLLAQVLAACALAEKDELGVFRREGDRAANVTNHGLALQNSVVFTSAFQLPRREPRLCS